jgi:hypothetical protein
MEEAGAQTHNVSATHIVKYTVDQMRSYIIQKDTDLIKGMEMLEFHVDGVVSVIVIKEVEEHVSRFSDLDLIFFGIEDIVINDLLHVSAFS